jgi:CTP synthase (UTP-ammonia lyase)
MKIGVIGDYHPQYPSHLATEDALMHSSRKLGIDIEQEWIPTASIMERLDAIASAYSGYWVAPGSPDSVENVYHLIQYAREKLIPLIGTCGGFQHLLVEYARNSLLLAGAANEEHSPDGEFLLINKMACSLEGQTGEVNFEKGTRLQSIYSSTAAQEQFRCNYGLNPEYQSLIEKSQLKIVASGPSGEPRAVELSGHPFYIGTLFVPQLTSSPEAPHPLINAFVEQAHRYALGKIKPH